MPVPKHRTSRSVQASRRGHIKLQVPGLSSCTNCNALIRPHRVCPECGYYKGVQILEIEDY